MGGINKERKEKRKWINERKNGDKENDKEGDGWEDKKEVDKKEH